jgi:cytochrome c oxidase assembly factor CtaG
MPRVSAAVTQLPLTPARWFTSWTLDVPVVVVGVGLLAAYLALARRQPHWPVARCASFASGVGAVLVLTGSFLGVYEHTLLWVLAVQDVLLLTTAPTLLVLARPGELLHRATGVTRWRSPSMPPLLGSLLAMTLLLVIYLSGWDLARLQYRSLFLLTPWWLTDGGPLTERIARERWQ